jgi:flavin reductase (DIM6/NTAB) family NADH-FMN oxidoreductase RutF
MKQKEPVPAGNDWLVKSIRDFAGSPVARIANEWMLITSSDAAGAEGWNTMTASWGSFGELWSKDVAFMFIRESRYTKAFADAAPLFTLSFFDKEYKKALAFCGEKSGRDYDKALETGLTPVIFDDKIAGGKAAGVVGFKEASEIIVCKKLYTHNFDPKAFLDTSIDKGCYPQGDYHTMYIGEALCMLTQK